ncbi:MAG: sigma-54-dependent Fis family transcriptional regulator [Gemmataceae bacterium]|nr:sigma-54-dependent Fis family transcriptional regulator [Gemmataceae bacterium]
MAHSYKNGTLGNRVALVAANHGLADAIQEHLQRHTGHPAFFCPFDSIRDYLFRDTDGLLLLAAGSPDDLRAVFHLVQDICLQKLPPVVVILEGGLLSDAHLEALDPYVARRLHWPADAHTLSQLVRDRTGRGSAFGGTSTASLEELLSRKLLALTPSLLPLVERIALAAQHDVTVLLNGETGTGKTFLARLVHDHSPRHTHRFLAVPCGAIAANLVESEFFGHVKGAFTGADRPKVGKFAAVGEGTLLLDEIDTLGLEQQATLLRVIETGEFEPVGSIETQTCTGRLIVASNINLEEAVERGRFRPDLYFRLNVMSFHLPPLRERVQDIAPLARGMAARFNRKFNKDLFDISPEALAALEAFPWPGNIRQLENVVQHAVLVSIGPELLPQHLPQPVQDHAALVAGQSAEGSLGGDSLQHQRDVIERNVIQRALIAHGYSRSRAADALGISRVTLYKKMKKYGLMTIPVHTPRVS